MRIRASNKDCRGIQIFCVLFCLLFIAVIIGWMFRVTLITAYHNASMNSAYDSLYGRPEPTGEGLAAYDVTNIDVVSVEARYMYHRGRLVELGHFFHSCYKIPCLSRSRSTSHAHRNSFVRRLWAIFPGHRHFSIAPDGTVEIWAEATTECQWDAFMQTELEQCRCAQLQDCGPRRND